MAGAAPVTAPSHDVGFELSASGTPLPRLLANVWQMRSVLTMLARKDFLARYRRTSLGLLWALGLPVLQAATLTIVFTRVAHFGREVQNATGTGVSYAVFIYAGIVAWSYFAQVVPAAATAIVDNTALAGKIYFPRLILPLVVALTGLYPLLVSVVLLLALTIVLEHTVSLSFLWIVPGAALAVLVSASLGLLLSALHVFFRDVRYIVQAVMLALFYATPVIYSLATAPDGLRAVLTVGPVAGPIELMRLAVGCADPAWWHAVLTAVAWSLVTGAAGLALHCRWDRVFVDRM